MKQFIDPAIKCIGFLALIVFPSVTLLATPSETKPLELTCYLDDIRSTFYPESEWIRENLLEVGVYDAARRNKSIAVSTLHYNNSLPDAIHTALEVNVHQWRRTPTGFFEFRAAAFYYDPTGVKHSLGIITGTQSSMNIITQYDVRDAFEEVVTEAFRDAFRKIEKIASKNTENVMKVIDV